MAVGLFGLSGGGGKVYGEGKAQLVWLVLQGGVAG